MPITRELDNLKKLESVGFNHEQAKILADIIEQSHVDSQQSLKEFIEGKFDNFRADIQNEFKDIHNEFKTVREEFKNELKFIREEFKNDLKFIREELKNELKGVRSEITLSEHRLRAAHTDLLMKFFGIVAGCITVAVAVSKLLW